MERVRPDLCVIGAGSGGLAVAAGAAQMGARVVLVEPAAMGGDCLNYGCVPSKALLAAARQAHAMRSGASFGVSPVAPDIDYAAVKDHVDRAIATIAPHDSQERFEALGVRVLRETARFVSASELAAGDVRIAARRFVIATGSVPAVPPVPGLADTPYETNETIFALRERPEHLVVMGGGPIGVEMAQAHVRLGSAVTVVEGARALGRDDPELAAVVLDRLRAEGVEIVEGDAVASVSGEAGAVAVTTGSGRRIAGSHLLVAVGRRPSLDALAPEAAGVAVEGGWVKTDAGLRSTNRRVYAVGDAAGRQQFTHVAGYHAGQVVRPILFGLPARLRDDHLPWVTYTDPELAQVGVTEAEGRARHGSRLEVVRVDYAGNDRAIAIGATAGLIKVMVVKGRPVGVSIAGAQAGELIGLWALAIAQGLKMRAIADMVAPYPTLGEISKRAAGAYFSPRLFDSPAVKRVVGLVQRLVP